MNRRGGQRWNPEASPPSCCTSVITPSVILRLLVHSLGDRWSCVCVCVMCLCAVGVTVAVRQSHHRRYHVYECATAL